MKRLYRTFLLQCVAGAFSVHKNWKCGKYYGFNMFQNDKLNTGIIPNYLSHSFGGVSKQGWYRIAKTNSRYGSNSCVISLKRSYNSPAPEYQKIQFFGVYDLRKFVSIAALSKIHMWTKIRETLDEVNDYSYIEIYQCIESYNNVWAVFVEEASGVYGNDNWKAIPPELTQETVSGVTVLTSLDLPANNPD